MGIQQTKSLLKTYYSKVSPKDPDDYLQKGFSPESLQLNEFLEHFWDASANEHFDWTNIQENKKTEEVTKEKEKFLIREKLILPELPLNPTITDNAFSIESLADYKEAYNPGDTKYFSTLFIKRMNVLLFAYVRKILSTFNENSTLECISKYFNQIGEDNAHQAESEIGVNLFIHLITDLSETDIKIKEETLDFLISNAAFVRPLAFWGETKKHYLIDKNLNKIVTFLKKIVENTNEQNKLRYKAFKIILNLGLAKGSLRNLLDFTDYFKYIDEYIDLNYEINLFKNEFIKLSLSYPTSDNVKVKSSFWNFKLSKDGKKKEGEESKTEHISITNDGSYIYLFSSHGYIAKFGTGYNNTMLGKRYQLKENYRQGEKGTIAIVDNVLYYRSTSIDPNPVICIDCDTLEEIPINYEINFREVNHLWVEGKKNEFEFPHINYKEMTEIIEKKKNFGAEDKSNLRLSSSSPMVTDGRYIYIFSKWYDDVDVNFDKQAEEDEEEEVKDTTLTANKKATISIYGVDVYDPLNSMGHVKSVKLNPKKLTTVGVESPQVDLLTPGTVYYTNGNIFVAGKIKFNLTDGEQMEESYGYIENLKTCCYDLMNNVIWGVTFCNDKFCMFSFFNHSAKPIVEFPETHPKFLPCSLEKIIQYAEDMIKIKNMQEMVNSKTFTRESTLYILGLEDVSSINYKQQRLVVENQNQLGVSQELYRKSVQCLILSTIAKLSEYYGQVSDLRSANTDEERGKILAEATRRPYCVKLEPETFEILIMFMNEFSLQFFSETESDRQMQKLNAYCILSTIKILRTNLKCLSVSNLELNLFIKDINNNPFLKMKEFIFKIFKLYHSQSGKYTKEESDMIKALYEECKIILQVSVNTLYPNYQEIIDLLEREIEHFTESDYSKDLVKSILEWMSSEDNMKSLLSKVSKDDIKRIFSIFKIISFWEVSHFSRYLNGITTMKKIPKYSPPSADELIAFKFASSMQIEILKAISKKLLNDNYEEIENEHTLHHFSTIIFDNILEIFKSLRIFLENVPKRLQAEWDEANKSSGVPEEEVIDTSKPIKPIADAKEELSSQKDFEAFKKEIYTSIWRILIDGLINNDLLIVRSFNFHINCLSVLSSSYIISSLMLNSYNQIIDEMNQIYLLLKEYEKKEEKQELSDYKEVIFESDHPYLNGQNKWFALEIPGEKEIFIEFDPQCSCKQNCAYVQMFKDTSMATYAFPTYTTLTTNFPTETLQYQSPPLQLYFYSDSCANSGSFYGFKVKVHNGKNPSFIKVDDKFTSMMRSITWVSCKCSAELLRGNFTKSLSSGNEEDDLKYNNILNSKLFAGGIDYDEIKKDTDALLTNILNIFEDLIPEEESHAAFNYPKKQKDRAMLSSILNGDNININIVLESLQKRYSNENRGANVGGDNASRLVRAAFASLIRHSGQTDDFSVLVDVIELNENDEHKTSSMISSKVLDEELHSNLMKNKVYASLYKKWHAASRMRSWLVEKKKNVDEALEKTKPKNTQQTTSDNTNTNPSPVQDTSEKDENNSEEIMKKIIDQTILKAKFLIKLNPSPAFSQEEIEGTKQKDKTDLVVRTSSTEEVLSEDDSWKRRLLQWRAVQKSKKVLKSVEEEANEKLNSLTSSVLMSLQSTVSSKRLLNKIKISTIRAKGREIGLMTIKIIFEKISHPQLIQDLLSWFCASLRKSETKICHYLDSVSGCGKYFEMRVQDAFQSFISLMINKLIRSENIGELKSFIDALMWKYSAGDHRFLVEQGIFMILWGSYNEAIKTSWGKPLKLAIEPVEESKKKGHDAGSHCDFTNDLLEIFEILANICLDRATVYNEKIKRSDTRSKNIGGTQGNVLFAALEKQVSILDENNSESLIHHILDVIFGEIIKAIQSYLKNRGISYNLWKQYEVWDEERSNDKKTKKKNADPLPNLMGNRYEDAYEIQERRDEVVEDEANADREEGRLSSEGSVSGEAEEKKEEEKKKEDENAETADTPYWYDHSDLITLYDEQREKNLTTVSKRIYCGEKDLVKMVYNQNAVIYDPEFLNRLLTVLYKCSIQNSDKIVYSIANPLNFASMFKLLRICPTPNKILISKILQSTCVAVPEEILIEAIDLFVQETDQDPFIEMFKHKRDKAKNIDTDLKCLFIDLIIDIICEIRGKAWSKDTDSSGAYLISSQLILLLRKILYSEQWNSIVNSMIDNIFEGNLISDHLRKEIILGIFGGDYYGQASGGKVRIPSDVSNKGISFNFIKKEFDEHYRYGTIVGFSSTMEEVWNKKQQSKDNKKKVMKPAPINLTPGNLTENQVGVLLNDSILKEDYNIMDLTPKMFYQHEIMVTPHQVEYSQCKFNMECILGLLSFVLYEKKISTSEGMNLKSNIMRFMGNYLLTDNGMNNFLSMTSNVKSNLRDMIFELLLLGSRTINHKSTYLNLELLEEKRYRVLNYCVENPASLADIPLLSVAFRKPNYILLRISGSNLLTLTYPVTGLVNNDNLTHFSDFSTFSLDPNSSSSVILLEAPPTSPLQTDSRKLYIVLHSPSEMKANESKYKKHNLVSFISLDKKNFYEILSIHDDLITKNTPVEQSSVIQSMFKKEATSHDAIVSELEEFGFTKELIEKEIEKSKECIDIHNLINGLIEYKEKRKELDEKSEEEKKQFEQHEKENESKLDSLKEDEYENEPKNECFNTNDSEAKMTVPEYFDDLLILDTDDRSLLFRIFQNLNEKIVILHSRRISLLILLKLLETDPDGVLEKIPVELIVNVLKLLTHEGLFLNTNGHGSEMLIRIKSALEKIFANNTSSKCLEIANFLNEQTLKDLETVLKGKTSTYEFIVRNEEMVIQRPMIFFSVWNLMIMNDHSAGKSDYTNIFNILSGLITKIAENKKIRWFILDLLIQFVTKLYSRINNEGLSFVQSLGGNIHFQAVENINKLRIFLDSSINRESKKNLSKRSQMIAELLIYMNEVDEKIKALTAPVTSDEKKVDYLFSADLKNDNFIADLCSTFEIMKEFFDKRYLKYLAWTEMNQDIINSSKITFESSHLYTKAPHSFLMNYPNTTALELNIHTDTLLDNGDAMIFSLDKNCKYPVECYANRSSRRTFTINSSHAFVHFPSNYLTEVYSFGSNSYSRLGQTGSDVFIPKLIESLSSVIVKDIKIGDSFSMVLTSSGDLLSCGNGFAAGLKQTANAFTKATGILQYDKLGTEGLTLIGVNCASTIVATQDYSLFSVGVNNNGQLGQQYVSPVNDITTMNFKKRIKQISMSDTHSMLVTVEGQVYHIGNNDYYQSGELNATRNNTPKLLSLNKTLSCEMVSAGEYFSIFLMKDIVTGKRKLYSSGWSKGGRTGTGKDEEYHAFKPLPSADLENIDFKYITTCKLSSAAISSTGKLFTWGTNSRGQLGHGHYNDVLEPTQVTFFDKFEVEEVAMSSEHTLVIAKDNEKGGRTSVYGFGDSTSGKLGETITQKSEKKDTVPAPIKISFFENKNPYRICVGPRASMVICRLKAYETLRDVHPLACSICEKNPVIGNLFVDIAEDTKYYCNDCIKIVEMNDKNPRIALKAPLKDYSLVAKIVKKYPIEADIDYQGTVSCKNCKDEIPITKFGAYAYSENKVTFYLCNVCIDIFPSSITNARIYLRCFTTFKTPLSDITNVNNFFDSSISYGYKFTVTPILNEKGCETLIEKHKTSFNNFIEDLSEYNKFEVYEQLVDLLNNIAQKAQKSIFTYGIKDLSFKKEELSVRSSIEKCSTEVLRKMFILLKTLNTKVKELLPFIDFSKVLQDNLRLSYYFNKITPLIFWDTKNEVIKYYLEKTASDFEVTELKINRMKVRRFIEKGKPDHTGEYTVFGHIFQFLKTKSYKIFRKKEGGNQGKMFNITFVGEASIDAGGPYREALTQAASELQSTALPLFIPSPNQKNESGQFREKWIVNPGAKSSTHLEMFKIFGGLVGYAMRTGEFINMDLPSIFWKQVLEVPLERKDLETIDRYTIQCLDDIVNIHKRSGITPELFSSYVEQKFTTLLSDGSEVELIPDGKNIDLTYQDRIKYCELVEKVRLEESKIQIAAIRSGLENVIPMGLLKLLSWKELETLVCGKPILDVELLKENTIYRGCSETDLVVQNLWKCLEEFSAEERSMYLRFVWGRSRLPLTSKDFPMKHRIEISHHNNPDGALPTSHTCFFSLEIPKYSTYEILKEKLKYAITHCQAIDTDGRPYEIWQDED